jgi:hypothetical protein
MNGNMVSDNTKTNPLINAGTRIGMLAPDNSRAAVEAAYLSPFSRVNRPRGGGLHFTGCSPPPSSRERAQQCDVRPLLDAHERHRVFLEPLDPRARE